ncbi:MAG: RdgB/HAM1 family non-canonical purine NTP pyrophosphatase [Acidimicrobiia bacterium]
MTTFVLATANRDKAREIAAVLRETSVAIDLVDRPATVPEVEEAGGTLEENARLKATALCDATDLPALADDTGLEVDALDGAPGVRSARYAGPRATYEDNVVRLLADLEGVARERRTARFSTVAVARWPDGLEVAALGTVEGVIAAAPRGRRGFGYDPVFVPAAGDGRTFAEMTDDEKHAHSHRGEAFRTLAQGLRVIEQTEGR